MDDRDRWKERIWETYDDDDDDSIFDLFKSLYKSFDFWMEWILERTVCFMCTFGPNLTYLLGSK